MKVGILTFPNSRSYGAALQMFALYQACQDLGYEAEIINYYNLWMKQEKHMSIGQGGNRRTLWLKRKLHDLVHIVMKKRFARFESKMQKYPQQAISDPKQLLQMAGRYGAVICGSDQVWNPDITNRDLSYFLNFCAAGTSRISYAPSFGVESLAEEYRESVSAELKLFDHLSVREEAGKQLIREISGLDAELVLDPTFLLNAERWQNYENVHPRACGEYILYYTVRSSHTLWKHCLALAKKTNMKILRIGSNVISKQFKKMDGVEYISDIGPAQWLYLVRNASYVVTNSFHGTAFAINYRKNFYVEFSSATNSRLSNIVELLNLEDRVLRENTDIMPASIDYTKTEKALTELKDRSVAFLDGALKSAALEQKGSHA